MKNIVTICITLIWISSFAQDNIPSKEVQIKTTVQAAPEMYREGAKVIGYNQDGDLVTLRKGDNDMVCLATEPGKDKIAATCFGKELEPFMKRGRELSEEGKSTKEKRKIRQEEIADGKWEMPSNPVILYVLEGDREDYNTETGELKNATLRYVIHKANMTPEETGFPDKPQRAGAPWLMDAGSQRSHIMITPEHN